MSMTPDRDDMEELDRKIIGLISERSDLYIRKLKERPAENGLYSAEDRSRLFTLIRETNRGPLEHQVLEKIYTDILAASMAIMKPVTVAFLGPEGSFSYIPAEEFFSGSMTPLPQRTIPDVFQQVESGKALYGVVPVENSTEGSVTYTLDELIETSINVVSEKYIRVTYSLLSKSNDISSVKRIFAHPQSLGQCKGWIRNNLPGVEIIAAESTSGAAESAAGDHGAAAISSDAAAGIYGLNVLASMIEDSRQNYTRFFLIGRVSCKPTGNDKTSIVCAVKDSPGALLSMLRPFAEIGINMTKIESRPDKKKIWEYNFFIDFIGHKDDPIVKKALDKIRQETIYLKILGSYPVGN
jgi:chorismate mutase/prephenate dehydratase